MRTFALLNLLPPCNHLESWLGLPAGFLWFTDMLAITSVAFLSCLACNSSFDTSAGTLFGEDGVEDDEYSIVFTFFLSVKLRCLGMVKGKDVH